MFQEIGAGKDGDKRIVVLGNSLKWAGGPDAPRSPASASLIRLEDLLSLGSLQKEELFDGRDAHATAVLCYSSVCHPFGWCPTTRLTFFRGLLVNQR